METNIQDFLRVGLTAIHNPTSTKVRLPQIHFTVEKFQSDGKDMYFATCLEYSQGFEDVSPQKAVVGLIDFMYRYFFTVLKKEGKEFLFNQVESPENDKLWGAVRKFLVEKYSNELDFITKSHRGAGKNELLELAKDLKNSLEKDSSFVRKEDHDKIVNKLNLELNDRDRFIDEILKLNSEQKKAIEELTANSKRHTSGLGLEGAMEWEEGELSIRAVVL